MSIKARLSVGATIIALIAGYVLLQGTREAIDRRTVSILGLWLNSPRPEGVEVHLSIGGKTETTRLINAPFGPRVYKLPRGTRVMIRMRLLGASPAKFLGCSIKVDDIDVMFTPPHNYVGPGTESMCWAVV